MIDLTITQALQKLKSRAISATELTRAYLNRMEKFGKKLNCYITQTPDRALADAAAADARYADGTAGALDGIPIGMKDLFATRGIRTTAASRMLENFVPEYESTVSQKLIDAGTVLLGKTNLDEFAMGTFSKTSFFGAPVNPWQLYFKSAMRASNRRFISGDIFTSANSLITPTRNFLPSPTIGCNSPLNTKPFSALVESFGS